MSSAPKTQKSGTGGRDAVCRCMHDYGERACAVVRATRGGAQLDFAFTDVSHCTRGATRRRRNGRRIAAGTRRSGAARQGAEAERGEFSRLYSRTRAVRGAHQRACSHRRMTKLSTKWAPYLADIADPVFRFLRFCRVPCLKCFLPHYLKLELEQLLCVADCVSVCACVCVCVCV